MWAVELLVRPDRDDPGRVDIVVRNVIVALDVIEIDRFGDAVDLIQIAQITVQIRIIHDAAKIAFKVPVVDRIEANERYEKAPIGFERFRSEKIALGCETFFHEIEGFEDAIGGSLVGGLRGGEAGTMTPSLNVS